MMRRLRTHAGILAAAVVVLAACADSDPTAPAAEPGYRQLRSLSSLVGEELVQLKRTAPLTDAVTASKTIDSRGGWLWIADALFIVPAGAVKDPVEITMTALPGDYVDFEFQPHGLKFAKAPSLLVGLRGTEAWGNSAVAQELVGAYHEDAAQNGKTKAKEVRPTTLQGFAALFYVEHFSKYTLVKRGFVLVGG